MHEQMERLYQAALSTGKLDAGAVQTSLAHLLNVAPQNVNNWESRGPSKEALLVAQRELNINATWVLYNEGPMIIGESGEASGAKWPFDRIDERKVRRLTAADRQRLEGAFLAAAGFNGLDVLKDGKSTATAA